MKISRFLLLLILFSHAVQLYSQSVDSFVRILEEKGKTSGNFVDGESIITEVEFVGLDVDQEDLGVLVENSVYESDFITKLRGSRQSFQKDELFSAYKVHLVTKALKEWLSYRGYPLAMVTALGMKQLENRMRLRFLVERGSLITTIEIGFSGNERISSNELIDNFKSCSSGLWKNYEQRAYEYFAQKCSRALMYSKGFFQSKVVDITSQLRKDVRAVQIKVNEGPRYRVGEIRIEGNQVFSEKEILAMMGQRTGEVADGREFQDFLFEKLKQKYDERGYVQYNAEFEPNFIESREHGLDGIVNVQIIIDEGCQFKIRRIKFIGVSGEEEKSLIGKFSLKTGDIFSSSKLQGALDKLNEMGRFETLDKDTDVGLRTDEEASEVDIVINVRKSAQ